MLSSETKVVTYVNKRGERSTYPLNSAMESANVEMVKRLKYTKDILTHMLNQNAGMNRNGATGSGAANLELGGAMSGANIGGLTQSSRPGELDLGMGGMDS